MTDVAPPSGGVQLRPGLCSVSLRALAPAEVARRAARAGLERIEWGGDIHVPPGDLGRARDVARLTADHGLRTCSYGSYWRADGDEGPGGGLGAVLDAAEALGAAVVRVWAGRRDARAATVAERAAVADRLRLAAEQAHARGMRLACEFHDGTLTSTAESARLLLAEVGHPALRTYWQPPHAEADAVCLDGLRRLAPWLENLHVFHWWPSSAERRPLADGATRWRAFLAALPADGRERSALLEFLPGDDPELLDREAASLRALLA